MRLVRLNLRQAFAVSLALHILVFPVVGWLAGNWGHAPEPAFIELELAGSGDGYGGGGGGGGHGGDGGGGSGELLSVDREALLAAALAHAASQAAEPSTPVAPSPETPAESDSSVEDQIAVPASVSTPQPPTVNPSRLDPSISVGSGTGPGIGSGSGGGIGAGTGSGTGSGTGTGIGSGSGSGIGSGTGSGIGAGSGSGTGTGGGKGVMQPQILEKVEPVYPESARQANQEGTVSLRIEILTNGRPGLISIAHSSGYQALDNAAVAAVKRWRFVPARSPQTGAPVPSVTVLPMVFRLN